jgi:hypothetical protein
LELPCPELLRATLHYLYTGELPGEVTRTVPDPDLDVLFGLLANAKFLLCDGLITDCVRVLEARIKSKTMEHGPHEAYKRIIAHTSFCPDLVPVSFIAELLSDNKVPAKVRLEMVFSWVERAEGPLPGSDQELLRPSVAKFATGVEIVDDATLADLCKRFPTGFTALGPSLLVFLAQRLANCATLARKTNNYRGY